MIHCQRRGLVGDSQLNKRERNKEEDEEEEEEDEEE